MFSFNQLPYLFTLSILTQICFFKLAVTQDPVPHTIVTRLIHYLATDSPHFDPNKSTRDLAHSDLESSIHRASYLTANRSNLFHLMDIESQLAAKGSGFLAHLSVGSQFLGQFVYMDTGSSLLWINCEPCVITAPEPLFKPKDSTSFVIENCENSGICYGTGAVKVECSDYGPCTYEIQYANGGFSKGYLARETFKFGRSRDILRNIVFGCSRRTSLTTNGVLGLGSNRLSLIAQRDSSRFSYCIGNIKDTSYPYHTLVIGDQVELLGYKTPLIIENKYYITLEGIKIGDKALEMDPQIFKRNPSDYTGGMLVDTGSTYTLIPQVVLDKFEAEITSLIDYLVPRNYSITYRGYTRLCYNGVLSEDLKGFPTVQFQFQGDATMELTADNIFHQYYDENFCLVILPSELLQTTVSILGNVMQQFFYISYDLKGRQFAFQRRGCETVDDYIHDELGIVD